MLNPPSLSNKDFVDAIILGFDFGTKKIGVASGQTITKTATPIATIYAVAGAPDWQKIADLIKSWKPKALVVGLPLYRDGTISEIAKAAIVFAEALNEKFTLPVFTVNERLTSKHARERILISGGPKALKKSQLDAAAAQVILEEWLQQMPHSA